MLTVILNRLNSQVGEIIAEKQAEFIAERSTTEQTFNLGILCETYLQHQHTMSSLISKKTSTEYIVQPYGQPSGSTISVQI